MLKGWEHVFNTFSLSRTSFIYKLIVVANRDEFYDRPAKPAHFWEDEPDILAGRDLLQMGTWLGVS